MSEFRVDQICDRLFISNFAAANCLQLMEGYGFTHILVVAVELPEAFPGKFTYLKVEVDDKQDQDIRSYFEACHEFIDSAMRAKSGKLLVHCFQGISRSATIVVSWLMKRRSWDFSKAIEFVRRKRPEVNPNPGFIKQLKAYDDEIAHYDTLPHQGCECALL
jgi:hypothetical protein